MMDPRHVAGPAGPGAAFSTSNPQEESTRCWRARDELENAYRTCGGQLSMPTKIAMARQVLNCRVPVQQRYRMIDVPQLVCRNEHHGDNRYAMMRGAFDILEKYAFNLLKPPGRRPESWRYIRFGNTAFAQQVNPVVGTRDILEMMGYSVLTEIGLEFSPSVNEPNHQQVSELAADLILAKVELDLILKRNHPYSDIFFSAIQSCASVALPDSGGLGQPQRFGNAHAYQPHGQGLMDHHPPPAGIQPRGVPPVMPRHPPQGEFMHDRRTVTVGSGAFLPSHAPQPYALPRTHQPAQHGEIPPRQLGQDHHHDDSQHLRRGDVRPQDHSTAQEHSSQQWNPQTGGRRLPAPSHQGVFIHDRAAVSQPYDPQQGRQHNQYKEVPWHQVGQDHYQRPYQHHHHGDVRQQDRSPKHEHPSRQWNLQTGGQAPGDGWISDPMQLQSEFGRTSQGAMGGRDLSLPTTRGGWNQPSGGMMESSAQSVMPGRVGPLGMVGSGPQSVGMDGPDIQGGTVGRASQGGMMGIGQHNGMRGMAGPGAHNGMPGVMATGHRGEMMGPGTEHRMPGMMVKGGHGGMASASAEGNVSGTYMQGANIHMGKEQVFIRQQQQPPSSSSQKRYSMSDIDRVAAENQQWIEQPGQTNYNRQQSGGGRLHGDVPVGTGTHLPVAYGEEPAPAQRRSGLLGHVQEVIPEEEPARQPRTAWENHQQRVDNVQEHEQKGQTHASQEGHQEPFVVRDGWQELQGGCQSQSSGSLQQNQQQYPQVNQREQHLKRQSTGGSMQDEVQNVSSDEGEFHTPQMTPTGSRNSSGYIGNSGSHNTSGYLGNCGSHNRSGHVTDAKQVSSSGPIQFATSEPPTSPVLAWTQGTAGTRSGGNYSAETQPIAAPAHFSSGIAPSVPIATTGYSGSPPTWQQMPTLAQGQNGSAYYTPPTDNAVMREGGTLQPIGLSTPTPRDAPSHVREPPVAPQPQTFLHYDIPQSVQPAAWHDDPRQSQTTPGVASDNQQFSQGSQAHGGQLPAAAKQVSESDTDVKCDCCLEDIVSFHCHDCSEYRKLCESCDRLIHKRRTNHYRVWPNGAPVIASQSSLMQSYPGPTADSVGRSRPVPKVRPNRAQSEPEEIHVDGLPGHLISSHHTEVDASAARAKNQRSSADIEFSRQSAENDCSGGSQNDLRPNQQQHSQIGHRQPQLEYTGPRSSLSSHLIDGGNQLKESTVFGQKAPASFAQGSSSRQDDRVTLPPLGKQVDDQLLEEPDDPGLSEMATGQSSEGARHLRDLERRRMQDARDKKEARERFEREREEQERVRQRQVEQEMEQQRRADAQRTMEQARAGPIAKPRSKLSNGGDSSQAEASLQHSHRQHQRPDANMPSGQLPPDVNNLPPPEVQELDIQLQKLQANYFAAGQMVQWLKEAERNGAHTADEVNVACQLMLEDFGTACDHPLQWIREKWPQRIQLVRRRVTALSPFQEEISMVEAEEALRLTPGDIEAAAQHAIRERSKKATEIRRKHKFGLQPVLNALSVEDGCEQAALVRLQKELLCKPLDTVWNLHSVGDNPPAATLDKELEKERRIRILRLEYNLSCARAENLLKLMDMEECSFEFSDALGAVRDCYTYNQALSFLQVECVICFELFPRTQMRSPPFCSCNLCEICMAGNFNTVIKEKNILQLTCPICTEPNLSDPDSSWDISMYFNLTEQMVRSLVDRGYLDPNVFALYLDKVRDYCLRQMATFIWCSHCQNGFENPMQDRLCVECPYCHEETCFKCRNKWEPQHRGITCEQFRQWKRENDPDYQAQGLAAHMEQNGIDCPQCKFRYELARGACMHFKCTQCRHEFCSGCSMPFLRSEQCRRFESCKKKGMHAHCPRDCLNYLRDCNIDWLQQLLRMANIKYRVDPPEHMVQQEADGEEDDEEAAVANGCPVIEQKDDGTDAICGREVEEGNSGLCKKHYIEYLVELINRYALDPAVLMDANGLTAVIRRHGKEVPEQERQETIDAYTNRLRQFVLTNIPLERKRAEGVELPQPGGGDGVAEGAAAN